VTSSREFIDPANPFADLLAAQQVAVLDGGLATALEARGHDLRDRLWSARLLLDAPDEIVAVHRTFLEAGADCVITASYQVTVPGFAAAGHGPGAAADALSRSVALAGRARDHFMATEAGRQRPVAPLVAASVGPYGAYLADGSEYDGRYGVGRRALGDFHRERFRQLAGAGPDLLACETIPSRPETEALLDLLDETEDVWAWFSFTCHDARSLRDGTPFVDVVGMCDAHRRIAAVGVNCTSPEHVEELVRVARTLTALPIVVYPNSGERWDGHGRRWIGQDGAETRGRRERWLSAAEGWVAAGAAIVGGCCRVGPETIEELRARLLA
jgi:homocysteine S-methyltransferase